MIKIFGTQFSIRNINRAILLICLAITFFLVILYVYEFHDKLSDKNSSWGEFGDFIGGTLGPILSFANLFLFLILTYKVSDDDQHRWITQIRIENYKDLLKKLYLIRVDTYQNINDIVSAKSELEVADLNNYFFLEATEKDILDKLQFHLFTSSTEIKNALNKLSGTHESEYANQDKKALEEAKTSFEKFSTLKKDLIDFLGNIMTGKDTNSYRIKYLG
jgi:hypothetical protein